MGLGRDVVMCAVCECFIVCEGVSKSDFMHILLPPAAPQTVNSAVQGHSCIMLRDLAKHGAEA